MNNPAYSIDLSFHQPWFQPFYLLTPREEKAFRKYFTRLQQKISEIQLHSPGISETSLTAGLVQAISGFDSAAKKQLIDELRRVSQMSIEITAREFPVNPQRPGETLDFMIDLLIHNGPDAIHRSLLVEAKRLYPLAGNQFGLEGKFKELNKLEKADKGTRVRSAIQAKTIMECGSRAGVFMLYCPMDIESHPVGTRILFPETTYLVPRQPTLNQLYADTLSLPDFMLDHFFCGRRGVDYQDLKSFRMGDSTTAIGYQWTMELTLAEQRLPSVSRRANE